MLTTFFVAALASVASALSNPRIANNSALDYDASFKHFDCGTDGSAASKDFLKTIAALHVEKPLVAGSAAAQAALQARAAAITVPTYFHVVSTKGNANMVNKAMVSAQLNALNAAYTPYGINFNLKNTSWTVSDSWAVGGGDLDNDMKKALRQGTYNALNLYFQTDLNGGILGQCTLPTNIGTNPSPSVYIADGCNIAAGTMPNGPIYGYNQGKTAVHETGHWLGLLHTFEGNSCSGSGDYVTDTPMESEATNGCPTSPWKNTCGKVRAGLDPIHNYMDYSTDACYTRFTPGQATRIKSLWPMYRKGK